MSDKDSTIMEKYGITVKPKLVYHYKEHRYDQLKDAVNFAKKDASNRLESNLQSSQEQQ